MFIGSNPHLYGNLSLQVLCMKVHEGVNVIVDYCPKAALRYGQVNMKLLFCAFFLLITTEWWSHL